MIALIISIISGVGIAYLLFRPIFPDKGDFSEAIGYAFTPDIISLFTGKWGDDFLATFKLNIWLLASGAGGYIVFLAITEIVKKLG